MSHFFAYLARMRLINRWPLMRNTQAENVAEHSLQVAMFSHMLATIENRHHNGQHDPQRLATLALFHDASEVLTGDLPTPVKYFNENIRDAYKQIEAQAEQRLLGMLPEEYQGEFASLLCSDRLTPEEARLLKTADMLSAYVKCLEELNGGNHEFVQAKRNLEQQLSERMTPALREFLDTFIPGFSLTLDELSLSGSNKQK